jgi:hypothetical protein
MAVQILEAEAGPAGQRESEGKKFLGPLTWVVLLGLEEERESESNAAPEYSDLELH